MGARTLDTADSGPVLRGLFAVIMCQRGCGPFWCLSQKRICLQAHSGGWQVSVYCGQSTPVPCWLSTRGYPQVVFFFFFCHGDLPNLLLASPQQTSWKGNRKLIKAEVTGFRKPVSEGASHCLCRILLSRRNLQVQPVLNGRGEYKGMNRETSITEGHLRSHLPPSLCLCFLALSLFFIFFCFIFKIKNK